MEGGRKQSFAAGLSISNIGGKISYSDDAESDFIPTNLRIGGAYTMRFDKYNRFVVMADVNKLLVPTPPLREGPNVDLDIGKDWEIKTFHWAKKTT